MTVKPYAKTAAEILPREVPSNYPEPFKSQMKGRIKSKLGDSFGLKNFGVNLTILKPNAQSSLFHKHTRQDEFIYILEGNPTLITEAGEEILSPGMCAGFPAQGSAHQLINRSAKDVIYIEIGDRTPGDEGVYPNDDLKAQINSEGGWEFTHKNGTPYPK